MAYLNHLFSISDDVVPSCRSWAFIRSNASKAVSCSHLVAYWLEIQPLGEILGRAIDGGAVLHPGWQHALCVPTVHHPSEVAGLHESLVAAWAQMVTEHGEPSEDDWGKIEIGKLIDVFEHATAAGNAVVSILEQSTFRSDIRQSVAAKSLRDRLRSLFSGR